MKDYREMADSVYEAVREENFKKAKRAGVIRKAVPCCCVCCGVFAAVIVMGNIGRSVNLNPNNYQLPDVQPADNTEQYQDETKYAAGENSELSTSPLEGEPVETDKEFVQIGWVGDADGNEYPATVEADKEPFERSTISHGLKPSDMDKILNALNYCFDSKATGFTDYEGVKVITYSARYYNVYVECSRDDQIYALQDGKVISAGFTVSNGYNVQVQSGGKVIHYCHLNKLGAQKGDNITKGQVIGFAGNSGMRSSVGASYLISDLANALDPMNTDIVKYDEVSFVSDPVANEGISPKETEKILNAINKGNTFGSSLSADDPTKDYTLADGIKVRVFAKHTDLLLNTEDGEEIYALEDGSVGSTGHDYTTGYSHITIWNERDKTYVVYCHLGEISADVGDVIKKGQVLGTAGKGDGETQSSVLYAVREP